MCYICKETTTKEHCIHYGALACFSCRAFFRRSHQGMQDKGLTVDGKRKHPEFVCKKNGKCNVTPRTRRRCQKCRYDRCITAGMQPDAVMTDDQVKVRFRKMFTKRADNKRSTSVNSNEEHYESNGATDLPFNRYLDEQEDGQSVAQHTQGTAFVDSHRHQETERDQLIPQGYHLSSSREETNFLDGNTPEMKSNLLSPMRTASRALSAPLPSNAEEVEVNSSNFYHRKDNSKAKEATKQSYKEAIGSSGASFNFSKKHRILGWNVGREVLNSFDQSKVTDLLQSQSWECNDQPEIKSEKLEIVDTEMAYRSYTSDNENDFPEVDESNISIFSKEGVKDMETPESYICNSPEINLTLKIKEETPTPPEVGYGESKANDNEYINTMNQIDGEESRPSSESIFQMISDAESRIEQKSPDMTSSPINADEDPFCIESSIDFDKCIKQGLGCLNKEEECLEPAVFKSPSLPISSRKRQRKRKPKIDLIVTQEKEIHQSQGEEKAEANKYYRMCKRVSELTRTYRIACSQVYFPSDLVNKLINFHVGCTSVNKDVFFSCAQATVS